MSQKLKTGLVKWMKRSIIIRWVQHDVESPNSRVGGNDTEWLEQLWVGPDHLVHGSNGGREMWRKVSFVCCFSSMFALLFDAFMHACGGGIVRMWVHNNNNVISLALDWILHQFHFCFVVFACTNVRTYSSDWVPLFAYNVYLLIWLVSVVRFPGLDAYVTWIWLCSGCLDPLLPAFKGGHAVGVWWGFNRS